MPSVRMAAKVGNDVAAFAYSNNASSMPNHAGSELRMRSAAWNGIAIGPATSRPVSFCSRRTARGRHHGYGSTG
jgi:hypothetical protein